MLGACWKRIADLPLLLPGLGAQGGDSLNGLGLELLAKRPCWSTFPAPFFSPNQGDPWRSREPLRQGKSAGP